MTSGTDFRSVVSCTGNHRLKSVPPLLLHPRGAAEKLMGGSWVNNSSVQPLCFSVPLWSISRFSETCRSRSTWMVPEGDTKAV